MVSPFLIAMDAQEWLQLQVREKEFFFFFFFCSFFNGVSSFSGADLKTLDWNGLVAHLTKNLPRYAIPGMMMLVVACLTRFSNHCSVSSVYASDGCHVDF